jgi:hypothetical protein
MEKLGEAFFKSHNISRVSFRLDIDNRVTKLFQETVESHQELYERIFKLFYQAFQENTKNRLTTTTLQSFQFTLPVQIPVAMAGRTGITVLENNNVIAIDLILNINPNIDETVCLVTCTEQNAILVERFLAMYQSDIERLSLIENWMLYGSDHWFIKPNAWLSLSARRREILCEAIRDQEEHIGSKCELSIFDAARKHLIEELKAVFLKSPDNTSIAALIAKEYSKMD